MELPEELTQLYKRHIFACATQRPPLHPRGSCGANGAGPLWEHMGRKIEALGPEAEIGFTLSGCLGFCSAGPLMVIYPEGVWYRPQSNEDVDLIVERHLLNDELAEDLVVVLGR
jgi:(2Fe-2S) ferredoxin